MTRVLSHSKQQFAVTQFPKAVTKWLRVKYWWIQQDKHVCQCTVQCYTVHEQISCEEAVRLYKHRIFILGMDLEAHIHWHHVHPKCS